MEQYTREWVKAGLSMQLKKEKKTLIIEPKEQESFKEKMTEFQEAMSYFDEEDVDLG